MAEACNGVPTATLFSTSTTQIPTLVVSTVRTRVPVPVTIDLGGGTGTDDDDDDDFATYTTHTTSTYLSTYTSFSPTTVLIPTATLFSNANCIATRISSTARATSTVVSALATVNDGTGSTSIVYITYTQTMSSLMPVIVTVVEEPTQASDATLSGSREAPSSGLIAGAAVGGVAGLALIGLLIWFCMKRSRRYKDTPGLDDLFQRSTGHMGRRQSDGEEAEVKAVQNLTRGNSQYSKGAEAGATSSGEQSGEEESDEVGSPQQSRSSYPLSSVPLQNQHQDNQPGEASPGQGPVRPPSYVGHPLSPIWPLNVDTSAATIAQNGAGGSTSANHTPSGNSPYSPQSYAALPPLDRSGSNNSRLSYHYSPDRRMTASPPPTGMVDGANMLPGSRPLPHSRASTSSIHLSPPSSPPMGPHLVGPPGGTPPWFASPRFFPNPNSPRPRSIADELERSAAGQGQGPYPSGDAPQFSPPSRPSSPPTQFSPQGRQSSYGSPPMNATIPSVSRVASPLMRNSPTTSHIDSVARRTSTGAISGGTFPRQRAPSSSSNLLQMRNSLTARQQQQEGAGAVSSEAGRSFGVQTAVPHPVPNRRMTASPPPLSYDGNWPPSRYSHLDMATHGRQGGEGAHLSPTAATSPTLAPSPTSPALSPHPSNASLGRGLKGSLSGGLIVPSSESDLSRRGGQSQSLMSPMARAGLSPPGDVARHASANSSHSASPASTPLLEQPAKEVAATSRVERRRTVAVAADEEEEGGLREAERNLVWGSSGKRHTLFVANQG